MSYDQTSLTTNLDDPGAMGGSASASGDRAGALAFAGLLLIMVGVFHALQGLVALLSNEFYVVGENYWLQLDFTTWGWVHLVLGTLTAGAGVGLFFGQMWARTVAVIAAGISMVASFMWLPFYPVWSLVIMGLDVFIMWAAILHGRALVEE